MKTNEEIDNGRLYSRLHKTWCFPTCGWGCNPCFTPCRELVSRSKRRYVKDSFNLDLTLVTPRIIVHGFPAIGIEHLYRNPRGEIRRFMDHYHKDHYKMYNFCCEYGRGYDHSVFYNRVERYPFKDHNTPPLLTMHAFATSAKKFLEEDPLNVVNMHCKAGKGRAGLMCCVLLIRTGFCQSAKDALAHYDKTRVKNNKGLTVTSQRKFVIFYEILWRKFWNVTGNIGDVPADSPICAQIPTEPDFHLYGVEVLNGNAEVLKNMSIHVLKGTNGSPVHLASVKSTSEGQSSFDVDDVVIQGNFKVAVHIQKNKLFKEKKAFELWHNTLFFEKGALYIDFELDQIDIKRQMIKKYGPNIVLRLKFTREAISYPERAASVSNNVHGELLAPGSGCSHEGVELIIRGANVENGGVTDGSADADRTVAAADV